ncbi:MAG: flavodoxin family protein [Anaerolineae bacterium]|jgi:flavodoxin
MKVLIAYYSETGNTAQVARAIGEEIQSQGYGVHLRDLGEIAPDTLTAYDLIFLGSACHDADLAKPVKQILDQMPVSPSFKLAGFATHASHTPEGGERQRELHERWAAGCQRSFRQASQEKGIDFLGYFGCQGAPSPPIERFIHSMIVTDEDEWEEYVQEARKHPDEDDLRKAKEFAQKVVRGLE